MTDQLEQDLEALLARRAAATDAELAAQRAAIAGLPDRGRRAPRLAWAAVVLVAIGFAAAAIWRFEGTVATPPVHPSPVVVVSAPPATPAPSPTPAGTPPAWIGTMVGMLQCKWPIAPIGEAVGDAPIGGEVMDDPDTALAAFLDTDARVYTTIPLSGWARLDHSPRWTLYGSLNDGRRVALIVIEHTAAGWVPYQLAACDAADFTFPLQPGTKLPAWVDGNGSSMPATVVSETADCYDGTQLRLDGRLYVRDLRGAAYDRASLLDSFDVDTSLPADAVDTGYRQGQPAPLCRP